MHLKYRANHGWIGAWRAGGRTSGRFISRGFGDYSGNIRAFQHQLAVVATLPAISGPGPPSHTRIVPAPLHGGGDLACILAGIFHFAWKFMAHGLLFKRHAGDKHKQEHQLSPQKTERVPITAKSPQCDKSIHAIYVEMETCLTFSIFCL